MDRAGEKLRQARERLKLTYRDVADASQQIAARRGNPDFNIPLSRLADIENRGRVPTIFRLYTLCAIYHLDLHQVMGWYGVPVDLLAAEALQVQLAETHAVEVTPNGHASVSLPVEADVDPNQTTFLSRLIRRWGKVPLSFIEGLDLQHYRYGLVGLQDWSMFPVLRPGALVLIDETQRKVVPGGWTDEFDRPIISSSIVKVIFAAGAPWKREILWFYIIRLRKRLRQFSDTPRKLKSWGRSWG